MKLPLAPSSSLIGLLALLVCTPAKAPCADTPPPTDISMAPQSPARLPGDGLKARDFLYTGQLDDILYLVRNGEVVWSDSIPGAYGHVQQSTLLSNGNLLLAYMTGAKEITPDKKVVWNYTAPKNMEVHTAIPIGKDKVLFVQNSTIAEVFVADKTRGTLKKLFSLPVGHPDTMHMQSRRAQLTDEGTLLLARTDLNKVSEFDENGQELWSVPVARPWSVQRLPGRHILVCSFEMFIRELDEQGRTVWEFTPKDAPGYTMPKWCVATRLPNGNTLVANNAAIPAHGDETRAPIQAFEIAPDKSLVWALRSWNKPALGPAWIIQPLDEPVMAESRHFGNIR